MILFSRGQANTFDITVTEKVTLASPVFLFRFTKESTLSQNTCIASNSSSYTNRYDRFTITESTTENRTAGTLKLEAGDWKYEVYEQTSASNLTVTADLNKLEEGICRVQDTSLANTIIEHREATTYVE